MTGLNMDVLRAAMELMRSLPPTPMLASSELLPHDAALSFNFKGRVYIGAGPAFWDKARSKFTMAQRPEEVPLGAVTIWNIDAAPNRAERAEFFGALTQVMAGNTGPIEDAIATALLEGQRIGSPMTITRGDGP